MNKNKAILAGFIGLIITFTSCKKCISCIAEQSVGNLNIETPYETYCGNTADVEAFEKGLKNQVPEYVTINCVTD